ncbi:hypothetical protein [Oceanobacter mangrovi]|uniref:hypothetical protein n=1 Tax=Oceanobacter mangrovi TaxID=2862510 RepID=UPI001C8EFE37|nr:hypothetical protein [Oceanobacter mangrovi]
MRLIRCCYLFICCSLLALPAAADDIAAARQQLQSTNTTEIQQGVRQALQLWQQNDGATEIEVGELILLAWTHNPVEVAHWFDQHADGWDHWVTVQDYLFLSLMALEGPSIVIAEKDVLLLKLQQAASQAPKAGEYYRLLQTVDFSF